MCAQGITALHLASYEGHADICKLLLEAGARVDERDNEGRSALLFAVQEGQQVCFYISYFLILYMYEYSLQVH